MNEMQKDKQSFSNFLIDSASVQILSEIDKQPKMSTQVAAKVARNLDNLLNELKIHGVKMYAVCQQASLGSPTDRDSKALYKYRNPEGSKPRDYIVQATKYLNVAEAIANLPDHPYSGSSGELIRRIFAGSAYAPALTARGDASIALKTLMDETVAWIARHIDLPQAYSRLERMFPADVKHSNCWQYELATNPLFGGLQSHGLVLELGLAESMAKDDQGHPLRLKADGDEAFSLCFRQTVNLYIGVDDDGTPRPYLAFEHDLVATNTQGSHLIDRVEDGAPEGEEFGELLFNGGALRLPRETVGRTVDLENLDQYLQQAYERGDSEEVNPVLEAFLEANPEYASHPLSLGGGIVRREIESVLVTADALEYVERVLSGPGGLFKPMSVDSSILIQMYGEQILFGDGILAELIAWFTNSAWLKYEPDEVESIWIGKDMSKSPMAPPAGWIGVNPEQKRWPAPDLLWLRSKIFVKGVEAQFTAATQLQHNQYQSLLRRLRGDENYVDA